MGGGAMNLLSGRWMLEGAVGRGRSELSPMGQGGREAIWQELSVGIP